MLSQKFWIVSKRKMDGFVIFRSKVFDEGKWKKDCELLEIMRDVMQKYANFFLFEYFISISISPLSPLIRNFEYTCIRL